MTQAEAYYSDLAAIHGRGKTIDVSLEALLLAIWNWVDRREDLPGPGYVTATAAPIGRDAFR